MKLEKAPKAFDEIWFLKEYTEKDIINLKKYALVINSKDLDHLIFWEDKDIIALYDEEVEIIKEYMQVMGL